MEQNHVLDEINQKLGQLLSAVSGRDLTKQYLSARDVALMTGLDHRTILNRSNLPRDDRRFIPSVTMGSSRKYFERKVILRLFNMEN